MPAPSGALNGSLASSNVVHSVLLRFTSALLFGTLLVTNAAFQSNVLGQNVPAKDDVLRVSTDLAVFPIRVGDKNHHSVAGLTERDFLLKDEDQATTALYFAAGAERVAMVFALDQSGSLREIISQQRDTALALFGRFKHGSRVAVLRFAEHPTLIIPFNKDPQEAGSAFVFSASPNQHTAIFDAAAAALRVFDDVVKDPAERRIVILLSDGLDNASKTKASNVIEAARTKGVSFYTIHLALFEPRDGRLAVRPPAKGFRELAEKTGGRYFLLGDARSALELRQNYDLTPIFQAIENDLKSQYLVGFYVSEGARDGRDHRVSISLARRGLVYSVGQQGFARTHHFSVNPLPRKNAKPY